MVIIHNPNGVDGIFSPIPKVALADSGNLGLEDRTPLGFFPASLNEYSDGTSDE